METNRIEIARQRGRAVGNYCRSQGIHYSKHCGCYPSNPYAHGTPEQAAYDEGYEETDDQEPFRNGPDTSF